jgi:phosphopentomutase
MLEVIKYNRLTTAAVYSWEMLRNLAPPKTLDASYYLDTYKTGYTDLDIMEAAVQVVTKIRPDFCFVYLGGVDQTGHEEGWMSAPYLSAVGLADQAVQMLMQALIKTHLEEEYTIILQSDHGGEDYHHMQHSGETIMNIPWIVFGTKIRQGHRIQSKVTILDTAPLVARLLNITPHTSWQGIAPEEIFADR